MRYVIAAVLAIAAGFATVHYIGKYSLDAAGGVSGGLYSGLITYPAALLAGAFVFWIVYAAMDPGSDK
jgi:hypothetical protein